MSYYLAMSLKYGRYRWRQGQVLSNIEAIIEKERKKNRGQMKDDKFINFVRSLKRRQVHVFQASSRQISVLILYYGPINEEDHNGGANCPMGREMQGDLPERKQNTEIWRIISAAKDRAHAWVFPMEIACRGLPP